MSSMERIKAVRLRLPETIAKLKFKNEKFDCDDDLTEYLYRPEFSDIVAWKEVGKFRVSYGASIIDDEPGYISEDYIDFLLDKSYDDSNEFVKSRCLTDNELSKYIPKFKNFFEKTGLPKPEISVCTLRVVEYCYYNGSDAPCCFDESTDPFYNEV